VELTEHQILFHSDIQTCQKSALTFSNDVLCYQLEDTPKTTIRLDQFKGMIILDLFSLEHKLHSHICKFQWSSQYRVEVSTKRMVFIHKKRQAAKSLKDCRWFQTAFRFLVKHRYVFCILLELFDIHSSNFKLCVEAKVSLPTELL